ncbi:DUF2339 domain-containing protein [Serratia liquefaciens]
MDGLVFIAGLALLLCLIVLPISVVISLGRGKRNQYDIEQLTLTVTELRQQVDCFTSAKTEHLRPDGAPLNHPVSAEKTDYVMPKTPGAIADVGIAVQKISLPTGQERIEPEAQTASWLQSKPIQILDEPEAQTTAWLQSKPIESKPKVDNDEEIKDRLFGGLFTWFMQGNPLAKLGIMLLFFGVAYLLKYTVERDMLPIEFRLIGAAATSGILLWFGWRLRLKRNLYALILQGGAIGTLYITVFGAFRLYQLLPHMLAFGLMLVICAASVGLAVLQRAPSLAILASFGGYLSPLLLSTGSANYVALFSYYLLLSLGILAISIWQSWRPLNLLGFIFTFGIAGVRGVNHYSHEYYLVCQLLLIANIMIFGVLCLALALRSKLSDKDEMVIDSVLLFGTPLIGFGIQYWITRQWEFGPAFSALGFGLLYLLLAWVALKRHLSTGKMLAISWLALGCVFTTLAIPLALSAQWTSMAWALEGVGILWLGRMQQQIRVSLSGSGLLVLALVSAVVACHAGMSTLSFTLVFAVLAFTWLVVAFIWREWESAAEVGSSISWIFLFGGICLWLVCLLGFVARLLLVADQTALLALVLVTLSVAAWRYAAQRMAWFELGYNVWLLWPAMLATLFFQMRSWDSLLASGWLNLVWLMALPLAYWLLKRDASSLRLPYLEQGLHLSLFWMVLLALGYEVFWRTARLPWGMDEWRFGLQVSVISLIILATHSALRRQYWPFVAHRRLYGGIALAPLIILTLLFLFIGNMSDGVSADWLYLPLLNPLEEGAGFAFLAMVTQGMFVRTEFPEYRSRMRLALLLFIVAVLFWWGNGILLRILAFYAKIAWRGDALWASHLVQTSFSLIWMLAALITMLWSTRHQRREVWFSGAGLLGVVILKLIFVDSAQHGGLARAVSFIGVAILVLIVGYFSPLPPKTKNKKGFNMDSERGNV